MGLQDQRSIYQSNIVHASRIIPHEYFSKSANANDIALIKLSKRVDISGRYVKDEDEIHFILNCFSYAPYNWIGTG